MADESVRTEGPRLELGAPPRAARTSVVIGIIALAASFIPLAGIVLGVIAM
jgi:hypothetical protein